MTNLELSSMQIRDLIKIVIDYGKDICKSRTMHEISKPINKI